MSTRILFALTLAAALFATGCAKKEEPKKEEPKVEAPAVDLAAEEQAIRNRSGEWMNYVNSKDMASIANGIFAPDAIEISEGKAYKGTAAIQGALDAQLKKMPNALVSWTSDHVLVAKSGDLAFETGSFNVDPDGEGKKPAIQGSFATTWAKVDGQWRALSDAGGENPPASP
ncbi:MAG TPA: nuclear transport factor 2 family protein [Steroidobacteraceae bacterium]|jgi:ketosteroid isomerase-like protein